jgi:hypothetical protein
MALLNPSMKFFREAGAARLSKKFHSINQPPRFMDCRKRPSSNSKFKIQNSKLTAQACLKPPF